MKQKSNKNKDEQIEELIIYLYCTLITKLTEEEKDFEYFKNNYQLVISNHGLYKKMKEEFNLSEKTWIYGDRQRLDVKDVKEFIRLLKEEVKRKGMMPINQMVSVIDKIAGDELSK